MILAVIPARAGSQRLPRKNLLEIEPGLSLVQHAIDCARHSGLVADVCVSSDDAELPYRGALRVHRPIRSAGPTADIADAVKHALERAEEMTDRQYDFVLTLQPAVLARSPLIVRRIIERCAHTPMHGAITAARTVPWQWTVDSLGARNGWSPNAYPRSQDSRHHLAEINAVQLASRDMVLAGKRWGAPLTLVELPPWCAALDIDTPEDMAAARDLWPWARTRLETWEPVFHPCASVNGSAA
jgi:CMP-N-acetylneuraminic acid synthetase